MGAERASETYTRSEIRRILGINENRLRSWERVGLTEARKTYTFRDLISLTTLKSLREHDIPTKRILEALKQVRMRLADVGLTPQEIKLVPSGQAITVELPGGRMEALTGQMLFDFEEAPDRAPTALEPLPIPSGTADDLQKGETWFRYALDMEASGASPEEVIRIYHQVLGANEDAAGAWVNIGTLYYGQRQLERAALSYREALRIYPEYPLAHFNLGNLCEEAGDLDAAAEHFQAALRGDCDYADAHYNLALVQERRGLLREAAEHWQSYLRLDPESPWAAIARRKRNQLLRSQSRSDGPAGGSLSKPIRGPGR